MHGHAGGARRLAHQCYHPCIATEVGDVVADPAVDGGGSGGGGGRCVRGTHGGRGLRESSSGHDDGTDDKARAIRSVTYPSIALRECVIASVRSPDERRPLVLYLLVAAVVVRDERPQHTEAVVRAD